VCSYDLLSKGRPEKYLEILKEPHEDESLENNKKHYNVAYFK
jgi:hypothetical protein